MASNQFPIQNIPEKDKLKPSWGAAHLDYAVNLLTIRNNMLSTMNRLYMSYNGEKFEQEWFKNFSRTHGINNKAKLVSYRFSRNKLDLINGEYLKMSIKATVETENSQAKTAKFEHLNFMRGAMSANNAGVLDKLKEVGVDVTEGMQIPTSTDDPLWEKMSYKDKNEEIMQIILNTSIKELGIQWKTAKNLLDVEIVSGCWSKVDVTDDGKIDLLVFDPRDAIYVEIENDPFIERSPVKGVKMRMTVSEVLQKYSLSEEQRKTVEAAQGGVTQYVNNKRFATYLWKGGDLCVDVIHMEWISTRPEYFKLSPKTNNQMALDPSTPYYTLPLTIEKFEENPNNYFVLDINDKTDWSNILTTVPNGKIAVIKKYKQDIWEATRIASCMDVQVRRKYFQIKKVDNKAYVNTLSYHGFNFQTVDGLRISLQETLGNFDNLLDITVYQILKELNSAKGRALFIDRGLLSKTQTAKSIIYNITNDGFETVDSTQDGINSNGADLTKLIHQVDLGFSSSLPGLLQLKNELLAMMDRISGINENREGYTKASSTAINAQNSVAASRTITEPLFFHFNLYVEKLLMHICEAYKIKYAFFDVDKGKQILGDKKQGYLQVLESIGYQDYGVTLGDGSKYAELKQRLEGYIQLALNTKEITVLDAINAEVSETYSEMKTVFKDALQRVQDAAQQQAQQEHEHALEQQQNNIQLQGEAQQQMQNIKTDADLKKIQGKGVATLSTKHQEALNKVGLQDNEAKNKILVHNATK